MIAEIRYVLAVPDLQKSAAFYRDVLGFTIHEIGDPGWRFFLKDGFCVMAGECPDAIAPRDLGDHAYFAYIVVDDIDAYFEQVRDAGAEILKAVQSEPWGMREFAIRTADGHRIMFGMEI
jgi:catechol 2,3-dioxygenase-like lactoylglutathione lyase family enzyme